jgi:hypothetical protein
MKSSQKDQKRTKKEKEKVCQTGEHQTVRCLSPDSPVCTGPFIARSGQLLALRNSSLHRLYFIGPSMQSAEQSGVAAANG